MPGDFFLDRLPVEYSPRPRLLGPQFMNGMKRTWAFS